ncbi:CE1759 family FMN reductase [Nocardioides sp. LS1]|uniref:CE1759 family FMN reductase n=1 Tax=Nocardioides sp. LS1 TaxID=1027620 RepID=UPI000F61B188|nr:CE1759 family FMN reductase [Nocardioides sp. LS1]GCD89115.1 oxidoreductase [Nocardioides sp. LS1]
MTRIVVVSAGLGVPSSTRLLADRLAAAATAAIEEAVEGAVDVRVVELRPLAHALADATLTGFASGDLADVVDAVRRADALIAVTPVFSASYSGLFKMFFDVLEPGVLEGTPVLVAATAGSARHSLVLDHALRPLFSYLHAVVVPTGVFAASEDFGSTADGQLAARVDRAAADLADLVSRSPSKSVRDLSGEFGDTVPFEELLRRV